MWEYIKYMRNQSEETRRGFAFFAALSVTGFVLASYWVLPKSGDAESRQSDNLLSPFAVVKRTISAGSTEIKESISEIQGISARMPVGPENTAAAVLFDAASAKEKANATATQILQGESLASTSTASDKGEYRPLIRGEDILNASVSF